MALTPTSGLFLNTSMYFCVILWFYKKIILRFLLYDLPGTFMAAALEIHCSYMLTKESIIKLNPKHTPNPISLVYLIILKDLSIHNIYHEHICWFGWSDMWNIFDLYNQLVLWLISGHSRSSFLSRNYPPWPSSPSKTGNWITVYCMWIAMKTTNT